ncbi:hypothetical protein V8C37DRAFT_373366 [Trichoderma ceciliae]
MKASTCVYGLATATFAGLASASSPFWFINKLQTLDTTSTKLASNLQFTFEDASTSLTTTCKFSNAPGSGRSPVVSSPTPCENPQVKFTYIQTSAKAGKITITLEHVNAAGNVQGEQTGSGIADLACRQVESESGTVCFAEKTEIVPGSETGA